MRRKLLSVCLILAMVLPLMPARGWADEPPVARIDRKGEDGKITQERFTDLATAVASAQEGETVQLLTSIEVGEGEDLTIGPTGNVNITLDLNGNSIKLGLKEQIPTATVSQLIIGTNATGPNAGMTIKNNSNSGAIQQTPPASTASRAAVAVSKGKVTLGASAKIEGKNCGVQVNGGSLVVDSGTISGGTVAGSKGIEVVSGKVTVKAGSITGGANGIEVSNNSDNSLEVKGGTIKGSDNGIKIEGGTLIINGGTIESTGNGQGAGVAVSGSTAGGSGTIISIIDVNDDGNAGIQISGPNALHLNASSGTITASIYNGTFTGKGTDGNSIWVEGNVTSGGTAAPGGTADPGFIYGGKFVVRNSQNQLQKYRVRDEYLVKGVIQDDEGVVSGPEAKEVVITFNAGPEGEFGDEGSIRKVKVAKGVAMSELPKPTRKGYKFDAWYTEENGNGEKIRSSPSFSVDTTLYANWKLLIPVTFDAKGGEFDEKNEDGTNMTEKEVEIGDGDPLLASELPTKPIRKDKDKEYTFLGWYINDSSGAPTPVITAEEGTEEEATIFSQTNNPRVYALWGYTITFNPDGGTLKDGDTTKVTGAVDGSGNATLPEWPADPEKTGYKFDTWYSKQGGKGDKFDNKGDGTYYHPDYFDKPVTLYANWIKTKDVQLTVVDPIPAELTVGGAAPSITLKATGSVFVNSVIADMFSLTLNGEAEEDLNVTYANRQSDTEVTITLSKAPDDAGWLTVTVKESAFVSDTPPTKEPSVDIPVVHTITFDATPGHFEKGETTITTTVKEGDVIKLPLEPTRSKYEFTGWYTKPDPDPDKDKPVRDGTEITSENIKEYENLYAGWRQVIFTVTFEANGGEWVGGETSTEIDTNENGDGRLPHLPDEPTHATDEDLHFDGWYTQRTGGEKVTTETVFRVDPDRDTETEYTVYAHWVRSGKRTITFYANYNVDGVDHTGGYFKEGEDEWPSIEIDTVTLGQDQWPPDPICAVEDHNHVFDGWYTHPTGGEKVTAGYRFIDDTKVYAHWRNGPPYEITFDPGKGALVPGSSEKVETDVTTEDGTKGKLSEKYLDPKRNPTRDGYSFKGWYTEEGELVTTKTEFDGDAVIYARWGLTVTFDLNYKTTDRTSAVEIELDKNDEARLSNLPEPTRDGWYFDGWYTEPGDGEGELITKEFVFVKASTVYAHWTEKEEFTVTFNANGGSVTPSSARTRDGKLTSLPTPTRDGYKFTGWFTAETGGDQVKANETVFTSNATVYARWEEKPDEPSKPDDPNKPDEPNKPDNPKDPDEKKDAYSIRITSGIRHGTVSTSHTTAEPGTWVTLTVSPDTDYAVDWVEITRGNGQQVSSSQSGRRYSFTMPDSDVTVDAKFSLMAAYNTFVPPQTQSQSQKSTQASLPASAFTPVTWRPAAAMRDVPTSSWAYPAAQWAYQNGYLDTASDGTFRLDDTVSHIQLWKIMARWLGEPAWDDASASQWARRSGAAKVGSASGAMTRQNMVEYLYQCYFLMGGDVSVTGNLLQYRDSQQVTSTSAKNAWLWAVNKGIISGTPDGYLNPGKILSRGEFATILMRLCQKR